MLLAIELNSVSGTSTIAIPRASNSSTRRTGSSGRYETTRLSANGETSDMRCSTSTRPFKCGQVEDENVCVGKRGPDRVDACVVRAVTPSDEQCLVVEPEHVASVGGGRRLQAGNDGDPGSSQDGRQRGGFRDARGLADPEEDRALRPEQNGVVCVDRVGISGRGLVGQDNLGAALREQVAKLGVLLGDRAASGSARQPSSRQWTSSSARGGTAGGRVAASALRSASLMPARVPRSEATGARRCVEPRLCLDSAVGRE